eukprot:TRINITY_DN31669_c0_g1_i1.p1 TRINITY_DN31669_c0_g1~~TRINITY_DN31669_c0_g1_i1.p1  ORF type:complete len:392 (-),score=74.41 TRINITY_DN31669_c0_g1_i1:543-1649(-)
MASSGPAATRTVSSSMPLGDVTNVVQRTHIGGHNATKAAKRARSPARAPLARAPRRRLGAAENLANAANDENADTNASGEGGRPPARVEQQPPVPMVADRSQAQLFNTSSDPQLVSEYAVEIFQGLEVRQYGTMADPDAVEDQAEICYRMRAILIDWMIEVHMKYTLKRETLYLAVNLVDRYLSKRQLPRKDLQLVGLSALWIAAKFEEIYPPDLAEFTYMTQHSVTSAAAIRMENVMLTTLQFQICAPTVATFLSREQQLHPRSALHGSLVEFALELAMLEVDMLEHAPSQLVIAAYRLADTLLAKRVPGEAVREPRLVSQAEQALADDLKAIVKTARGAHKKLGIDTVIRKFSQEKYASVALLDFD